MSITIEAIYEAGLLRPLEPLNALAERARVRVTIETSVASDPAAVSEEGGLPLPLFRSLCTLVRWVCIPV